MTIKHTPHYSKVLYIVLMIMHTKVREPNHLRKGEETGRFNLEGSLGEVVETVFNHLKESSQQPVCA